MIVLRINRVVLFHPRADKILLVLFATLFAVLAIVFATLAMAPRLVTRFGQTGLNVMTRIMGLLLTVIGVQFIIDGARPVLLAVLRSGS